MPLLRPSADQSLLGRAPRRALGPCFAACAWLAACGEVDAPAVSAPPADARPEGAAKPSANAPAAEAERAPAKVAPEPAPSVEAPAEAPEAEPSATQQGPTVREPAAPSLDPETPRAYFLVEGRGVVLLTESGFEALVGAPELLLREFVRGLDGELYLLAGQSILRLQGRSLEVIATLDRKEHGRPTALSVGPRGELHLLASARVLTRRAPEDGWVRTEASDIDPDAGPLIDIEVDDDGRLWAAFAEYLYVEISPARWRRVHRRRRSEQRKDPGGFRGLARSPRTGIHAWTPRRLYRVDEKRRLRPVRVKVFGDRDFDELEFSEGGVMTWRSRSDEVARRQRRLERFQAKARRFSDGGVISLAADDRKRIWVTSTEGLSVLDARGRAHAFPTGSVPELAGRILDVVVISDGPPLPKAGAVQRANLEGQLRRGEAPLVDAKLELCPRPHADFSLSPCESAALRFEQRSGPDGAFRFDDVPLGAYGLAVLVDDRWRITMAATLGREFVAGETFDLGALRFD